MKLRTRVVGGRVIVTPTAVRAHPRGRAWDRIRLVVAERDRWICQLCWKPINRALLRPDPMALHTHHVVAIAAGGTDELSNLAASHAICNEKHG